MLPERFYADFSSTYTPREDPEMPMPPWSDSIPPDLPYAIGRGYAANAADLGIMVENYTDYCVPIFKPNAYFACSLFNYNGTAYMISPRENGYGPCCVYREKWSPPHRAFMFQFDRFYSGETTDLGIKRKVLKQIVDWWVIPQPSQRNRSARGWGHLGDHPVFGGFGFARKPLPR